MTRLFDWTEDNSIATLDLLDDGLMSLAYPAHDCPCCHGAQIIAVRNGDDDVPCPCCGEVGEVTF